MLVEKSNEEGNDKIRQKIISPNDISSLFGGGTKSTKNDKDFDDEDEDFDYGDTVVTPPVAEEVTVEESSVVVPKMTEEIDEKTKESDTMRELFALEEMTKRPPVVEEELVVEEEMPMGSQEELVVAAAAVMESEADEEGSEQRA